MMPNKHHPHTDMKIVNAIERLAYYVEAAESKTLPADEDAKQAISSAEAKGLTGREKGNAVVDELMKLQDSRNIPANRRVQFDWMEGKGNGRRFNAMQHHVARFTVSTYAGLISAYWAYDNRCGSEWRLMDGFTKDSFNDRDIREVVTRVLDAYKRNPKRIRVSVES